VAFAAWEEAPQEQKAEASLQLDRTVRQLYNFVVRKSFQKTRFLLTTGLRSILDYLPLSRIQP
jgi:hypothetical protein